jgi:hypothetical protein
VLISGRSVVSTAKANRASVLDTIALNAGHNGRTKHCGQFDEAQKQWTDWKIFCAKNNDVLTGWNWWANSAAGWWNQGDSCDPGRRWNRNLVHLDDSGRGENRAL